jgi:hypothetical protein
MREPVTGIGDLALVQPVADRLHRGHVIHGGERVIQLDAPDPGLGRVPLGILVAVEDQPAGLGEYPENFRQTGPNFLSTQ